MVGVSQRALAGYLRDMGNRTKVRHLPIRLSTGGFILNAGLSKLNYDDEMAKRLHSMTTGTYPMFADMEPRTFTKMLAAGEIALGSALLVPLVPSRLVGLALGAFSGGLLGIYMKTPGMHQEGSIRPTQQGTPIAKDVWMLGIALTLIIDSGKSRSRR